MIYMICVSVHVSFEVYLGPNKNISKTMKDLPRAKETQQNFCKAIMSLNLLEKPVTNKHKIPKMHILPVGALNK